MSSSQVVPNVKTPNKEKKKVHVDLPEFVWDLIGKIAERYGIPKVDLISVLVISEARRLGIEIRPVDDGKEVTEA